MLWPQNAMDASCAHAAAARAEPAFAAAAAARHVPQMQALLAQLHAPLACWLQARQPAQGPLLVGINGAQGAGKSTLCQLLQVVLEAGLGLRVAVLSIDDVYLTHAERQRLAREVHPLLAVRGVPGTHDVALAISLLDRLAALRPGERLALPSFDKGRDDRRPPAQWPEVTGPVDIILFEGWCVGASAQPAAALATPINALEAEEDADGRWRSYVNAQLQGPYADLFDRLQRLILLQVPGWEKVHEWRCQQEQGLPAEQRMDAEQVRRFIAFYERLTRHMLATLPTQADVCLRLAPDHSIAAVRLGDRT
ncbi:MAG TPA: hypothetical protein QF361_03860 [Gammaproteobacteria bacterium]|nr:hypothetical protein [Gammaproteobacteria bacterium]